MPLKIVFGLLSLILLSQESRADIMFAFTEDVDGFAELTISGSGTAVLGKIGTGSGSQTSTFTFDTAPSSEGFTSGPLSIAVGNSGDNITGIELTGTNLILTLSGPISKSSTLDFSSLIPTGVDFALFTPASYTVAGTGGPGVANWGTATGSVTASAVPEPSAPVLSCLLLTFLLRHRRRSGC